MSALAQLKSTPALVALTGVLVAIVGASWSGCGNSSSDAGAGGQGTGGASGGSGGSGGAGAGGSSAGGTSGTSNADGGEACKWPGWYRAPRMPAGCKGLCVPDDVAKRVPKLEWMPRNDVCQGCQWLSTPWSSDDAQPADYPVGFGATGVGTTTSDVDVVWIGLHLPGSLPVMGYFDATGSPIAAWAGDANQTCGRSRRVRWSRDGVVGFYSLTTVGEDQSVEKRPRSELAKLMGSSAESLTFSGAFLGVTAPNEWWLSKSLVAADMTGRMAIGEFGSGKTSFVDQLPGAKPGEYSSAQVIDDAALVSRYDGQRTEWLIYKNGQLSPFLGAPNLDVRAVATDGAVIVWQQGSQPELNDAGATVFKAYDVYKAPFTLDPAKLAPSLLVPGVPPGLSFLQLENGYASAVYYPNSGASDHIEAFVVRVTDGWAATAKLPDPYFWGFETFPTKTELWGAAAVSFTSTAKSIVRYPYSAMSVIQSTSPGS